MLERHLFYQSNYHVYVEAALKSTNTPQESGNSSNSGYSILNQECSCIIVV